MSKSSSSRSYTVHITVCQKSAKIGFDVRGIFECRKVHLNVLEWQCIKKQHYNWALTYIMCKTALTVDRKLPPKDLGCFYSEFH